MSLFGALNKSASRKTLDIDEWYDVVAQIYDQTHLAAYHSWLYIRLLVPLIHRERARRKVSVLARIRAAQAEKLAALDADVVGLQEVTESVAATLRGLDGLTEQYAASRGAKKLAMLSGASDAPPRRASRYGRERERDARFF